MGIFNKVPLEKVIPRMQENGKRELVWYGVTIGQIGFGVLASVKRQPTKRATDWLTRSANGRNSPAANAGR